MNDADLRNRFGFHSKSRESHAKEHELIRQGCYVLATQLQAIVPNSRELALVLTHLEEVMFWANAGVARQDGEPDLLSAENPSTTTRQNEPLMRGALNLNLPE
jgi:hypothetical protein